MDFYLTLMEVIDMRSFSNLWYWIVLAVLWSSTSYYVLGVPLDVIQRAKRFGGQAQEDLEAVVSVKVRRLLLIGEVAGLWLVGFLCFLLSGLAILAFWYWVEFAQALFLLTFPLTFVGLMALSTAVRIRDGMLDPEALNKTLMRHRFRTQLVGMASIFVTAMFGMWQNFTNGAI